MINRTTRTIGLVSAIFCPLLVADSAIAQTTVSPPQGYIAFDRVFDGPPPTASNGTQTGYYAFDYDFTLGNTSEELAGTFWANNINFHNSSSALPPNHVGGDQGGYVGVQVKSATESIAIFSIWWALDARPGPDAHCVEAVEAWYNDDRPWEPRIHAMSDTDPSRPVAGGPFRSCRLPISLQPNTPYRLRLVEVADAREPDAPEWWGATFTNLSTGEEQWIGQLQVPGSWSWLQSSAGGFIEHFGPMPAGCDSIPATSSAFLATSANNGDATSSNSARLYGQCEAALQPHTNIQCRDGRCQVDIAR
ncbi:MAG: hypothetical protein KJO31_11290 [Gammaproteobacteria bacterium]|nr:hypothetical protein [Gammaproteobacteria bacterium]